jgi:hypothetical protein
MKTALQTNLSDEFFERTQLVIIPCVKHTSTVKKTLYNMPLETDKSKKAATGDALGEDIYDVEL